MNFMKFFLQLIMLPTASVLMAPSAVEAGGGNHEGHHDQNTSYLNMRD